VRRSLLLGLYLLLGPATSGAATDVWIDKAEDESYTARHECSFVQAGDKFYLFGWLVPLLLVALGSGRLLMRRGRRFD
jgi:hypothetical protein